MLAIDYRVEKGASRSHLSAWTGPAALEAAAPGEVERARAGQEASWQTMFDVLYQLVRAQGHSLRMTEIAERSLFSKGAVTKYATAFGRRGLTVASPLRTGADGEPH